MTPNIDDITIPEIESSLVNEINSVGVEYIGGTLYAKRALARVARLIIEDKYRGIEIPNENEGGVVAFTCQEDLWRYLHLRFGMSVSNMKEHLTFYRRLVNGLGMNWNEAFLTVAPMPGALRDLPMVATFDESGQIVDVNQPRVLALGTALPEAIKEAKDKNELLSVSRRAIKEFVKDAASLKNPREAAKMFAETLGKNTVSFRPEGDAIIMHYAERAIDSETGEVALIASGEICWIPNVNPPQWAVEKMRKRLNA